MSGPSKRWVIYPPAPAAFFAAVPEHPVLLQVLYNRGLRDGDSIRAYLASEDAVQENPYRMVDMVPAVQRLVRAIERGERICVYGDFDADGVTATALLATALEAAGARVRAYIPDRMDEGYGLHLEALERLARDTDLLVTVDCGIRSVEEVAAAARMGMDVIVTDHHSVGRELPPALAVVNPRRADDPTGFERLAGVGVAYRVAQGVLRAVAHERWSPLGRDRAAELEQELLDLVAVGTVADLMPLQHENRSLVRRGLQVLRQGRRVGLYAVMEHAGIVPATVDAATVSYRIAPRINAAGRLLHAGLAYDLLRATDYQIAFELATRLEALNQERQRLTAAAETLVEEQVLAGQDAFPPLLFAAHPEFQPGIVGLVAGKLTERYYRPVVVVEQGQELSRGSARSIVEFDIISALDAVEHLFVRHGGHARAAGFTVETRRLPELQEALVHLAAHVLADHPELAPTLHIDVEVDLALVDWALHSQLARMEPTGQDNPPALLLARGCRIRTVRAVGNGQHLKLVVDRGPGAGVLDAIAFRQGAWAEILAPGDRVDLVFYLEVNRWQGRQTLQLNVQDLRPADG